jgi:ribonuclease P protein subunit POP4
MRKPENILRHELIGLSCKVISSKNKSQIGIEGEIIDETMKTLVIETPKGRKRIEKKGTIFEITLNDKKIYIDGNYIYGRPEDRIKKKIKKW